MMKQQENTKPPLGGVTIKTEPGTSSSPVMQRLPSLRPPRDLSLSAYSQRIPNLNQAKNKKIFIPNLNVQRNKPTENVTIKTEPVKPNLPDRMDRGRGRGKRTLIQFGQGLFAEGIPGQKNAGRGRGGGGGETRADLKRPTLKLQENIKVDKQEEENTMKNLLRDDFVDDPTLEPDFDNCPITLPLLNCKEDPGLKKKCDLKPVDKKEILTINDVFSNGPTPVDPGFIFFQLPNAMPGLKTDSQPDGPKPNAQPTTSTGQQPETKVENDRCLLSTLPSGHIGKLQILKSGRARLVFGDTKLWLEMGTQVAFKQDLMSIDLNKETHSGHTINLGPVSVRMVATPDWEGMMAALKTEKQTSNV